MNKPYGNYLRLSVTGGSHDEKIGMRLENFPSGLRADMDALQAFLNRRAPGQNEWSTARAETDEPHFSAGLSDGVTDGSVLEATIDNRAHRSADYAFNDTPRPSHADFAAVQKYGAAVDLRGGGRFSGRLTALYCVAGGLCLQSLAARGIGVVAHVYAVGGIYDTPFDMTAVGEKERALLAARAFPVLDTVAGERMRACIEKAKKDGDSVGGIVECAVYGLPAGLGEHPFASSEERIAAAVFAIPGVKGIEFGSGFAGTSRRGSENNDPIRTDGKALYTVTNNAGGILGGMTNGMPLVFRAAVKPTPSIAREQQTVSLSKLENTSIRIGGRHDPCIVPRAVPVFEAVAALAVLDMLLEEERRGAEETDLQALRARIDACDRELTDLFCRRMALSAQIGAYKRARELPVLDAAREQTLLHSVAARAGDNADAVKALYATILRLSRAQQEDSHTDASPHTDARITGCREFRAVLIGQPLTHSFSAPIHALLADYSYTLRALSPGEVGDFLRAGDFDALNVTIPYKKTVLPYLRHIDPAAAAVGAVNTIRRRPDGLYGYNTDIDGFSYLLHRLAVEPRGKKALVLGSGGASGTVAAVLRRCGAEVVVVSRTGENTYENLSRHADASLLVNATPVGMFPNSDASPVELSALPHLEAVADLVYNPCRTRLLRDAAERGLRTENGLSMLVAQAKRACEIFLDTEIDDRVTDDILRKIRFDKTNIVLIGMPGCGKTTVGELLAARLGRPFYDTDTLVAAAAGESIPAIFERHGEAHFRRLEHEAIVRAAAQSGCVLATGGGCVTQAENDAPLRANGSLVFLRRPPDELPENGRPLSAQRGIQTLYRERLPLYERLADVAVETAATPAQTAARVLRALQQEETI